MLYTKSLDVGDRNYYQIILFNAWSLPVRMLLLDDLIILIK